MSKPSPIFRIGFSYGANTALTIPFTEEYMPAIKLLLGSPGIKVVWNESFDVPRVREHDIAVNGRIIDGMVLWHVLNSDLPKGLGFAATFLVPDQARWKHLGQRNPYYNAVDADVEWQCVEECERLIERSDLKQVFDEQVTKVDAPLRFMSRMGMPVDAEKRLAAAKLLDTKLADCNLRIQDAVPRELVRFKTYTKDRPGAIKKARYHDTKIVCDKCGKNPATKSHAKCKGTTTSPKLVIDYLVPVPFNPASPQQVLGYMKHMGHKLVMKKDKSGEKKPTTDEKALKILMGQNPDDKLYPLLLEFRELNKLAGTYIGRLEDDPNN